MNVALGAKLACRLISGPPDWWKTALMAKYFDSSRLRSFGDPLPAISKTPTWKFLKAASPYSNRSYRGPLGMDPLSMFGLIIYWERFHWGKLKP
jgi:hypothetical protein